MPSAISTDSPTPMQTRKIRFSCLKPPSKIHLTVSLLLAATGVCLAQHQGPVAQTPIMDTLVMGDAASEKSHGLKSDHSEMIKGAFQEPARRMQPLSPAEDTGGQVEFEMKVDPDKQNYFTAKFWGSDAGEDRGRLILFIDGKQVGYRHLGDVDLLNIPNDDLPYNNRFYYITTPLPAGLTKGKTSVTLQIRSIGRIWGYGTTWEQYQKKLEKPTVAVYEVYTHTAGYFAPPASEKQGSLPEIVPVRKGPGKEVLEDVKIKVGNAIRDVMKSTKPLTQDNIKLLALGYSLPWTPAYHSQLVLMQITESIDALCFHPTSNFASTNDDWVGWGSAAFAVATLAEPLQKVLDEPLQDVKHQQVTRRKAWSSLFQYSRDSRRMNRRQYTNQSMILDMNVYLANRAIELIDPANALPEEQCLHYLYQAVGLEPWLGSDTPNGPQEPLGDRYYLTTPKGLTKELGYVGYYGEILDWATSIYRATAIGRPSGDPKIRAQVEKLAQTRSYFRYPTVDNDGYRAMRIEAVVGWRDGGHYPGDVVYAERDGWDGSPSYEAAGVKDAEAIAYVQQMLNDHQYFADLEGRLKQNNLRNTIGLLDIPAQYAAVAAVPPTGKKLPMTWSNPDFGWADEEDGVLAVKHGKEILYVSLYWRARYGINNLARVHYLTPNFDRIATVHEDERFTDSGKFSVREDWVDLGFGKGHVPPGDIHQSQAGERLPIAVPYDGYQVKPGEEDPYAGRAELYLCRYGHYWIAMNSSDSKTFTATVPGGAEGATDLISGKVVSLNKPLQVPPKTTVVLYLAAEQ